jgi:hypothetical protein
VRSSAWIWLFSSTSDGRVLRRVQMQADDIGELLLKAGVVESLNGSTRCVSPPGRGHPSARRRRSAALARPSDVAGAPTTAGLKHRVEGASEAGYYYGSTPYS